MHQLYEYVHVKTIACFIGKDCGATPTVTNSSVLTTNTLYQGTSTYSCDTGYEETAGNTVLTCGSDASWRGTTPQCDSK